MRTIATTIAAAVLLAAAPAADAGTPGKVTLVVGKVTVAPKGGGPFVPVKRGAILSEGTTVKTAAASRAVVLAGTGSPVRIGPSSTLVLEQLGTPAGGDANSPLVELKSGTATILIDRKIEPNSKFKVRTAHGIAAARGTIYGVSADNKTSYAKVRRGKIDVRSFSKRPGKRR